MPRRKSFRGCRCLVTGASSGLGETIARQLASQGARVLLTGRSQSRLDRIRESIGTTATTFPADLTRDADRDQLFAAVEERFGGALDLLVNSAGVGAYGRFESHAPDVLRRSMEINFFAAAEVSRAALPLLRRGDRPSLVNIGSIVSRRGLPGRSEYSASKFALAGLTESLRSEWAVDGIHVLLVNPGFTRTAFERNLLVNTAYYQTPHLRTMPVEDVAAAVLRAIRRGKNEITLTPMGRLLLGVNRLLPRLVDLGLSRWTRRVYSEALSPPVEDAPAHVP